VKRLTLLVLCGIILLQGCTALGLVKAVMPGKSGTDVNANAQVGKENTQQVVANQQNTKIEGENVNVSQKETDTSINTSKVDSLVQNNTNVPMWYLLLLVLGGYYPALKRYGQVLLAQWKDYFTARNLISVRLRRNNITEEITMYGYGKPKPKPKPKPKK
jgi:hypothetical protein